MRSLAVLLTWSLIHVHTLSLPNHPKSLEHALITRQAAGGTTASIASPGSLANYGLDATCEQVLYQSVQCNPYVEGFAFEGYRQSLGNVTLTDAVCSSTCESSLKTARRRIAAACRSTPELGPGYPVLALIDAIYGGFNETCIKDKETSAYCNDMIDSWGPSESELPQDQLCSYCYSAKLRVMQQSPYSVYDEYWASRLELVNSNCGQQNPTVPSTGGLELNVTHPSLCYGGKVYTSDHGDSCDSIATAQSVSSATLYHINGNIRDCNAIKHGATVCLPDPCKEIYSVQSQDTCPLVAAKYGTTWLNIIKWNAALNSLCTNLVGSEPSWGSVICVTPPGGSFEGAPGNSTIPGNGGSGGQGGNGDGYSDIIVDPPSGPIAEGTTRECGKYVQAEGEGGCGRIIGRYAVPMDLFIKANPSLKSAGECSKNLQAGYWYCLNPWRGFNATATRS